MFDFIRSHQKLMQVLLLILVAPAFVLLGVSGYSLSAKQEPYATVGDVEISEEEFNQVKRQRIEEARSRNRENFDAAVYDSPVFDRALLNDLIMRKVVEASVRENYLTASDKALQKEILQIPQFQVDGRFDKEAYNRELAGVGMSAVQFEANLRYQQAAEQVFGPLIEGVFIAGPVRSQIDDAQLSGRKVQTLNLPLEPFLAQVEVTDQQIQDFYTNNQARYMKPATADVEYLVLSPDFIKSKIEITDADIASYYEQNKTRFSEPEERRARHILITEEGAGSEEKAKAEADRILAELKKDPTRFEELAKEFSKDPGSASNGGDLGFFSPGMMVPEFDKAVFELSPNQVSDVVKTAFGYHLIEVTEVKGGGIKPLEQIKDQIRDEIRSQKIGLQMAEAQEIFAEKTFEAGQSFEPIESALGLKAQTFKGLTAEGDPSTPVLADPGLLNEIFSEESIANRNNSKALTVGESLVSARIINYTAAAPRDLDEIRDDIRREIRTQEALTLASREADRIAGELSDESKRNDALKDFSQELSVSALSADGLSQIALAKALDTPAGNLPRAVSVGLGQQGYLVMWVKETVPASDVKASADPAVVGYYETLASNAYTQALSLAAVEAARARLEVKVLKQFGQQ